MNENTKGTWLENVRLIESEIIPIKQIEPNKGQIEGLPKNPRLIKDDKFRKLKKSIEENPEMTALREILVYPIDTDRYVIIGGNMRFRAIKDLGYKVAICKVLPKETTLEQLQAYTIKDNASFGDWDWDMLANEWDADLLDSFGVDVPQVKTPDEVEQEEKEAEQEAAEKSLLQRWVIPPMSVFDCRAGYWQDRKSLWRKLVDNENIGASREKTLANSYEMLYPQLYSRSREERLKLGVSFREYCEKYVTPEELEKESSVFSQGTSLFDPVLAEIIMKWFCPKGGKIIDPFGGEPTKGLVAGVLGFNYTAVEIRQEQVDVNRNACKKYPTVNYICGDSCNIDTLVHDEGFDLCFTSPPYYDLEVYSKEDLSALGTYEEFMELYEKIFKQCVDKMADNSFLCVKISEIRNKKTGVYRNFVGDNITIFKKLGLNYYNEIILVQPVGSGAMRAEGLMKNRKVARTHQNVLVFKKDQAMLEESQEAGGDDDNVPKEKIKKVPKNRQLEHYHENILVFHKGNPTSENIREKYKPLDYPELENLITEGETNEETDNGD